MLRSGDVVLARVQFTDAFADKKRPAVVLFEEHGNVVIAGITSNIKMEGIPISREEGAVCDSIIKLNYIFTVTEGMVEKVLFHLNQKKKKLVFDGLQSRLQRLL